tara:strand:+ start:281 stop:454 length:174 start_codon:yes stop_codon:yes gene_type:complete
MMYATNGTAKVTSTHEMSVIHTVVVMDRGGSISIFVVLVEPLTCIEVLERKTILLSF